MGRFFATRVFAVRRFELMTEAISTIAPEVTSPSGPSPVPQEKAERDRIRAAARAYAVAHALVPPLSMSELREHARCLSLEAAIPAAVSDFLMIVLSNEIWRTTVAGIPCRRRVLFLPQCLRSKDRCAGELDELGLLCAGCGNCSIGALQARAEERGYVVLVAEGTTVVTRLLEQGKVDAVIGVGCQSVLERTFPHMAAEAIPGIAIPLYRNGCDRTGVDLDWVRDALELELPVRRHSRVNIDQLRTELDAWFTPNALAATLNRDQTNTEEIGLSWLAKSGKRWRPLLAVCIYQAMTGGRRRPIPASVRSVALAVECFHKASLVHDDIEDNDNFRYGEKTLHREFGVPVALNAGDFLLGEGYRLIAECRTTLSRKVQMLAAAAEGHRTLCLGQGEELSWMRDPAPLSAEQVLAIFRRKTGPAFQVALRLGAICANADAGLHPVLTHFSEALGTAYQIRDDLEDFHGAGMDGDVGAMRPSLLLALAYENAAGAQRERIAAAWRRGCRADDSLEELQPLFVALKVEEKARRLLAAYRDQAFRALEPLRHVELKSLLFRLTWRILGQ